MRLIFRVKKGQLSMSFTQPPYYYGYIFPEYLLNQWLTVLKIRLCGYSQGYSLVWHSSSQDTTLYAVYLFHTSILEPGALFFLQLAYKIAVMVLYSDMTYVRQIPAKFRVKKGSQNISSYILIFYEPKYSWLFS